MASVAVLVTYSTAAADKAIALVLWAIVCGLVSGLRPQEGSVIAKRHRLVLSLSDVLAFIWSSHAKTNLPRSPHSCTDPATSCALPFMLKQDQVPDRLAESDFQHKCYKVVSLNRLRVTGCTSPRTHNISLDAC